MLASKLNLNAVSRQLTKSRFLSTGLTGQPSNAGLSQVSTNLLLI